MPDTKITALAAITTVDPAADVLPIVDISDTSMAASGTTKKITTNQILGSGGTATLASATITGDLTVDTSTLYVSSSADKVGIGTTSLSNEKLTVAGNISANAWLGRSNISAPAGDCSIFRSADNTLGFGIASTTAMTLNATGLGVGVASPAFKLQVVGTSGSLVDLCGSAVAGLQTLVRIRTATANTSGLLIQGNVSNDEMYINNFYNAALSFGTANTERLRIDASGNVGIGVTSPTSQLTVGSGGTANPAATVAFHKSTSDEYRLKLTSSTFNAAGKWIGLGLGYSSDYMKMAIIAEAKDTNARGNLYFALNNDATSANASIADAKMTLKSTGQVRFVPLAADPSGAEAGDVYYNSTSNKLKCYNGTTWNDLF